MASKHLETLESTTLSVEGGEPPSSFLLFKYGKNKVTKGNKRKTITLTKRGAEQILSLAEEHGADLPIDYDHAMVSGAGGAPDETGKAAGWFRLGAREDGLYAEGVTWTPAGHKRVSEREFRYTSPAVYTEVIDGEPHVVQVINVALTSLPASHGLRPLVANQNQADEADGDEFMRESLAAHLGLGANAAEAEVLTAAKASVDLSKSLKVEVETLQASVTSLTSEKELLSASLVEANGQLAVLTAKAEADAKAAKDAQVKALLDAAVSCGKITPHERTTLSKKADDLEWLKEFIGGRAAATAAPVEPSTQVASLSGLKWEDMKPIEKHDLKEKNPALYDALRADHKARTGGLLGAYDDGNRNCY